MSESTDERTAGEVFERVLGILRPELQRKLGDFETAQLLQRVRDEWRRAADSANHEQP